MINYLPGRAWMWSKPVKWWLTRSTDGRYIHAQEFLGNYSTHIGVMDDFGSFVYV